MKKMVQCFLLSSVLFLGACSQSEPAPKYFEDLQQINNGGGAKKQSSVVIDAIIDTEAEYAYISSIQNEYETWKTKYDSTTTQLSSLLVNLKGQPMEEEKKFLTVFLTDIGAFKGKIGSIDLPDAYRSSILEALEGYAGSVRHELTRVNQNERGSIEDETTITSNKLYESAQEKNLKVQGIYNDIMK